MQGAGHMGQAGDATEAGVISGMARLVPVQKRSRERFERILTCAEELLLEKGSDGFKMSDIVERTGVPFGSLYQYFPDKTAIIGTLAERYNAQGQACVAGILQGFHQPADLPEVLGHLAQGFYGIYQERPVTQAIWQATQADPILQALDAQDCAGLSAQLAEALLRVGESAGEVGLRAGLLIALIGAAVRHAITLPEAEGRATLAEFQRLLAGQG